MGENARAFAAATHDMNAVSASYESSLSNAVINTMTGDVVRSMLIQFQFIKKELLVMMGAIEELMYANEFNLRAMSTVPAIIAAWTVDMVLRGVFNLISGRRSRRALYETLRKLLLEAERLLTLCLHEPVIATVGLGGGGIAAPAPPSPPSSSAALDQGSAGSDGGRGGMTTTTFRQGRTTGLTEHGFVLLCVHQFRVLMWRHRGRFARHEPRLLEEDLAELAGERGELTIEQQLFILIRMRQTYKCLQEL